MTQQPETLRPPVPEDFGLTTSTIAFFEQKATDWLIPLGLFLGAVCGTLVYLVFPSVAVNAARGFWPVALAPLVVGFWLAGKISRIHKSAFTEKRTNCAHYRSYLDYQNARAEYERKSRELVHLEMARKWAARAARSEEIDEQVRWWSELSGEEFEHQLAALLEARGYETKLTPLIGDGGVDVFLRANGRLIIVQCKAHRGWISAGPVRELYGTLTAMNADEAWLITTAGGFFRGAKDFASGKPIRLFTIRQVLTGVLPGPEQIRGRMLHVPPNFGDRTKWPSF